MDYWLGINHGICNGNITVAISWSDYFGIAERKWWNHLLGTMDYLTAQYANYIFIILLYRLTLSPATDRYGPFIIIITALVYRGMKKNPKRQ
jgi:hypothetical protein